MKLKKRPEILLIGSERYNSVQCERFEDDGTSYRINGLMVWGLWGFRVIVGVWVVDDWWSGFARARA